MQNKDQLNPCPFCNSIEAPEFITHNEIVEMYTYDDIESGEGWYVICNAGTHGAGGCGAQSGFSATQDEAALKWNIRRGQ